MNAIIDGLARSHCENIRDFSISYENPNNVYVVKNLPFLLSKQKYISSLSLYRCINKEVTETLPAEYLETLNLNFCDWNNDAKDQALFSLNRFKNLKILECGYESISKNDYQKICSAIYVRNIDIEFFGFKSLNEKLTNCFVNLKNLETLSITYRYSDYYSCADYLIEDILLCESLKNLTLSRFYFTNKAKLNNIKIVSNLISLSFSDSEFLKYSQIVSFINIAPNLQELYISFCAGLTKN